ncbi:hypothetical protein L1887_38296 [Cichorium endivia]|nr:hypothetical protein L1887_38296 [Cichorium endivia]
MIILVVTANFKAGGLAFIIRKRKKRRLGYGCLDLSRWEVQIIEDKSKYVTPFLNNFGLMRVIRNVAKVVRRCQIGRSASNEYSV